MVFKNKLFFSSKKSDSSPDGSSSPRSIGSNSPSRSDKKKPKSNSKEGTPMPTTSGFSGVACKLTQVRDGMKKKEVVSKLKDTRTQPQSSVNPSVTALKTKNQGTSESKEVATSVSPILASSLGLNRIKTRSGPLPQESFFSIRGDKGPVAALGSSNLSRPDGGDGGLKSVSNSTKLWAGCGAKNKEDGSTKMGFQENIRSSGLGNSGRNSNDVSSGSRLSREQSPNMQARSRLQKGELSSESGPCESSWGQSGGLISSDAVTPENSYDCENPKESESPRFQAILRVTSAPRKRSPSDIKSFSHELNSKGVRPFPFWKPRGLNNLEEILVVIRAKFDKAKEEVNSDLAIFAADLIGILEKNAESHPEWQVTIEDLLVLARSCAMTSPGEFWLQCEGIVQELDDKRQELPPGMMKQLYTRMLFILTRCTRLLQFHKEIP